jgi:hypothetical protein
MSAVYWLLVLPSPVCFLHAVQCRYRFFSCADHNFSLSKPFSPLRSFQSLPLSIQRVSFVGPCTSSPPRFITGNKALSAVPADLLDLAFMYISCWWSLALIDPAISMIMQLRCCLMTHSAQAEPHHSSSCLWKRFNELVIFFFATVILGNLWLSAFFSQLSFTSRRTLIKNNLTVVPPALLQRQTIQLLYVP